MDISGFRKAELNGHYDARHDLPLQDHPSYWNSSSSYFAYWAKTLNRWSICGPESYDQVLEGAGLGWAFQLDPVPLNQSSRWNEQIGENWTLVDIVVKPAAAPPPPPPPSMMPQTLTALLGSAALAAPTNGAAAAAAAAPSASRGDSWAPNGSNGGNWSRDQGGGSSGSAWASQDGGSSGSSWSRQGRRSYGDWAEDRNVQARTHSGPPWASGANSAAEPAAGAVQDEVDHLQPVDWSTMQRQPFQRFFLPRSAADPQQALARRLELLIEVEEDPEGISATPMPIQAFSDLHCLPGWVHMALRENAWEHPLAVQAQALPILLGGRNLIGIAQTGSGKTGSFLLPAVVQIDAQPRLTKYSPGPVALVLSPTRELAVQISDEATKLLKFSAGASRQHPEGIRSAVFYGGGRKWMQKREFGEAGSHILVATPGRLLDVMREGSVSLRRVTYLVFDEADRMLDLGFSGDMKTVSEQVRPERQMAYFSATWPKAVQALACEFCSDPPVRIRIGGKHGGIDGGQEHRGSGDGEDGEEVMPSARETIVQQVVVMDSDKKDWQVIEEEKITLIKEHVDRVFAEDAESKVLIFVNEKGQVDKLSNDLWDKGFHADGIHSGRKQDMRLEVLEKFRKGDVRVLVATDVIGRGLDIPKVSHVIIHSMGDVDDYVHRIGRTGRGKDGKGHALVFFEFYHNRPQNAQGLIGVLERAKQHVPDELRKIAESVANGTRGGGFRSGWGSGNGRSWGSGGSGGWKEWDKDKENGGWKSKSSWKDEKDGKDGGGWKDGGWKSSSWKESSDDKSSWDKNGGSER